MKFESAKPGLTVWDVGRHKMGNTTMSSVCVWSVRIESVDTERRTVIARWNGNPSKAYGERAIKRWRLTQPIVITTAVGRRRLATRTELKEMRSEGKIAPLSEGK